MATNNFMVLKVHFHRHDVESVEPMQLLPVRNTRGNAPRFSANMRTMRTFVLSCFVAIAFLGSFGMFAQKTPPGKLTFKAKNGEVTFNHAEHVKREKEDCKTCHESLFKQDAKAPLNFKPNIHKTAEKNMTSCGSCHRPGGMAFETKGNCNKCHMK